MENSRIIKKEVLINANRTEVCSILINPIHTEKWLGSKAVSEWKEGSPTTFRFSWNDKEYTDGGKIILSRKINSLPICTGAASPAYLQIWKLTFQNEPGRNSKR